MQLPLTSQPPRVSFVLLSFNQERYIRTAVESALLQDFQPLQVVLSDDCSSDRTFEIMSEIAKAYTGPHRIFLNRNERNLGLIRHVNLIPRMADGELIVVAAGDDISRSDRTSKLVQCFQLERPMLVHSYVTCIDEDGIETLCPQRDPTFFYRTDLWTTSTSFALYIGATGGWDRRLFDKFGEITQRSAYEDLVMGFRSVLLGRVSLIKEPLVKYRYSAGISAIQGNLMSIRGLKRCEELIKVRVATILQRLLDVNRVAPGDMLLVRTRMTMDLLFLRSLTVPLFFVNAILGMFQRRSPTASP